MTQSHRHGHASRMSEPAPRRSRRSPSSVALFGLIVAFIGGMMANDGMGIGVPIAIIGGAIALFGIIATAVAFGIASQRER